MEICRMEFSGKLLKRGFWLYVWEIRGDETHHLYVGRTGDSSSPNASSPFRRIGQHLDTRLNAKGNALGKQLKKARIEAEACTFKMTAIGPIFDEQDTMPEHRPLRDKTGALERALAEELRRRGYEILGDHQSRVAVDTVLFDQLMIALKDSFPSRLCDTLSPVSRYNPIKLRGGEPISITIIRGRGHGSEHPDIAAWEASQKKSEEADAKSEQG
jgi:hypothetical protein